MELLERLSEITTPIYEVVTMLIRGIFTMFDMIPKGFAFLASAIMHLPELIVPFATVTVTVSVILFLVGRQNN